MLYDHHLTREADFREKSGKIWNRANDIIGDILSYREYVENRKPFVEMIERSEQ